MPSKNKKVLFLSYYFPPAGGSAVQRCLKFAKYLPQFGWQPIVLTTREENILLKDPSLCDQIPEEVTVIRTPAPDPYQIIAKGKNQPADLGAIATSEGQQQGLLQRLALWFRKAVFIPDARIGWFPFAVIKGLQIIRRENISLIFATSPPFTTALIAGTLSFLTGKPWISDYRDPWTQAYFYFERPFLSRWFENFLEKRLLFSASRVISINQLILDGMCSKFGFCDPAHQAIIPNGFDPEDFEKIQPVKADKFTITYTGTLNAKMHPENLLKVIHDICIEDEDFSKNIHLKFIGRMSPAEVDLFNKYLSDEQYELISHLPHRESLSHAAGSNLLLLLIPETEHPELIVTGKIFEYIKSGVPVLGMIPEGEATKIIRETESGFVVPPDNPEEIKNTLIKCHRSWKERKTVSENNQDKNAVENYSRKNATKQLSRLFDVVHSPKT